MPGPFARMDLLDQSANIAERVRKLEVMPYSRILKPRIWQPDKDYLDAITALLYIACGIGQGTRQRLSPVGHALFRMMDESGLDPAAADSFYRLAQWCGVGPRIDTMSPYSANVPLPFDSLAGRYPDTWGGAAGYPGNYAKAHSYRAGTAADWRREWLLGDIPCAPPNIFPPSWEIRPGGGTRNPGSFTVPDIPSTGFLKAEHWPAASDPSDYYIAPAFFISSPEDRVVARSNVYSVGETLADCGGPQVALPFAGGPPVFYETNPNFPCPNNPFSFGSSGAILKSFVIAPATDLSSFLAPLVVTDPSRGANVGEPFGVVYSEVFDRVQIVRASGAAAAFFAWADARIDIARSDLSTHENEGWQRLPLYPGWWGYVDVRYNERQVFFRGRVRCIGDTPSNSQIAYYPHDLPVGHLGNPGSMLQCSLEDGRPINVAVNHQNRTTTVGSDVVIYRPQLGTPYGMPFAVGQGYWEIRFDGATFARYTGG